mmetsp:Transcript_53473/g.117369  ORF Transcript_53473/g.117369 Transcript_53473/m.117369 type:complete len:241 (+) Transcript_53473:47-769(+)
MSWELYYHAGQFKGRAEPIRLLFADAGVEYTEIGEGLYGPDGMCDAFGGTKNENIFPVMFPPIICHKTDPPVMINNTPAIVRFVGDSLGYAAANIGDAARCDQMVTNCADFVAEGRGSFHPVDMKGSYDSQKEKADEVSKVWSQKRLPIWLGHFEKCLARTPHGGPGPIVGDKVTYADFSVFQALDAAKAQFNSDHYEQAWDKADVPKCKAYHAFIAARPNLVKYFASEKCKPWAGDSMM